MSGYDFTSIANITLSYVQSLNETKAEEVLSKVKSVYVAWGLYIQEHPEVYDVNDAMYLTSKMSMIEDHISDLANGY